ncbi:PBECR2 nuclease fold domain-containing protein, partial [Campylobacter upsaliensis]
MLNSLIKYAKGQGEKGVNNLQKIKDYLGEENNAFLEMQILNKLFKESVVENDRASLRVFDSEGFLSRVRELVGENELYERKIGKEFLEELSPSAMPKQISIDEFLNTLENFKNKENFLKHIEKDPKRKDYLNLIEPTLKEPDIAFKKLENGVEKEKFIKKFSDGKDFFYLLATKDNKETILTAFKTDKINTILKEFNADIIPTFIRQGSKGKAAGTTNEGIITQPLFKSKEAREFLELVEGFHKLYKNDASIAKNLVQGTSEKLSTSIATSAEGAIKQKVVKGAFDPIFRLLPDKILFGLFAKQIQGGALRYHLKKALSRSLNYDDFKIKLEKELKRTNFNSNTSRLIDEFMQNLDTFNAEKEAKLAKIREEQARIKEEERKRAEEIYQAQEANNLKDILEAEEKPLKDEFGVNFEGFKGKEAIEKLLEEQRGQVKGAFYKEGLGEIDLVWGEITDLEKHKGYGLAHILDKRKSEFVEQGASESEAAQKAAEFAKNEISNIMQNGKIINKANEATRIETQDYRLILKQNWKGEPTKNKWLVTAYMKKEKGESISSSPFTKEDNLSLNSNESIAQNALSADEAISILQSVQAKQVPKELDIEGFLKELESVENKENFISHLSKKEDAKSRLAYLNLVKPTLEEADLILKTKNKNDEPTKEFIKAFQDENKRFFYIVITEQDNEKKLLTAFKTNKLRELKNRIEKARDFGEISFAHRFIKKSPTAENILKQKSLNLTEKLYLKDNDTPLNVEYKIVNKDDIKPT